ncbi:MAG: phosphate/sulfate permease [Arenicella sp.]|jgi:phosphate/sulfate permease
MLKFIKDILKIVFDVMFKFVAAFVVGTGAAAIVCWYYSIPLVFSIVGGIMVLGLALALISESPFD